MPATPDADRADAVAWLVGRLAWEQLFARLQQRADAAGGPVTVDEPAPRSTPAAPARAA